MSVTQKFSQRVRAYRDKLNLTQKDLGEILGVSANYVGMIEGGKEIDETSALAKLFTLLESGSAQPPRNRLRHVREASGMSVKDAAKALGIEIGVYQAIEGGTGKASERLVDAMCKLWPSLDRDEICGAGDHAPRIADESARWGVMGQRPDIQTEDGLKARYVPLISWAQAGTMASFTDEAYQHEAHIAFNVTDRKAIAVQVRGDSMSPQYSEGDVVILYPSHEPRNGDLVIARLAPSAGEDVMFKIYSATNGGRRVVLTSYNPAYPALEYNRDDFAWIYPAASVVKNLRK